MILRTTFGLTLVWALYSSVGHAQDQSADHLIMDRNVELVEIYDVSACFQTHEFSCAYFIQAYIKQLDAARIVGENREKKLLGLIARIAGSSAALASAKPELSPDSTPAVQAAASAQIDQTNKILEQVAEAIRKTSTQFSDTQTAIAVTKVADIVKTAGGLSTASLDPILASDN
ncbi:hypothetical protein [uncultured Maritalea sp.]|jgi:hypothetical protein|uniref:hypothetical protein n=1 Tax=uncultured Maritalea sp. TaxID=757249 RepID=UPI002621B610|nr:hypothetical protein [uncultured Maritalea sp.]